MGRIIVCRNCRSPARSFTVEDLPGEYAYSYCCDVCKELVRVAYLPVPLEQEENRVVLMRSMARRSVDEAWRSGRVGRTEAYARSFAHVLHVQPGDFYLLSLSEARTVAFVAARLGVEGVEWHDASTGEDSRVHREIQARTQRDFANIATNG